MDKEVVEEGEARIDALPQEADCEGDGDAERVA